MEYVIVLREKLHNRLIVIVIIPTLILRSISITVLIKAYTKFVFCAI